MGITVQMDEGLFAGGPPLGWAKAFRVVRPTTERRFARPLLTAIVLGWLPVAVLAVTEVIFGSVSARSFFTDVAIHARFLIAVPLLILAEADAIPMLGRLSSHFLASGLVGPEDLGRYQYAAASTKRLLEAKAAEAITFLLAYVVVIVLILNLTHESTPSWWWSGSGRLDLSPPGMWHAFISVPLLLWLFFGWVWRLLLWWRFLALMSRLNLRLIPSHPDHAGGLKFVSAAIRGHRLLAFALGVIVAGNEVNATLHGLPHLGYKNAAAVVALVMLVLAAGPLSMFVNKLRTIRTLGILRYGPLAAAVGSEFERKWVDKAGGVDAKALEVSDFSATTDLYQVAEKVYQVDDLPFHWKDLTPVVVSAVVPFIPAALMTVPLKDILQAVKALLL